MEDNSKKPIDLTDSRRDEDKIVKEHETPAHEFITNKANAGSESSAGNKAAGTDKRLQPRLMSTIADALTADQNLSLLPDVKLLVSDILLRIQSAVAPSSTVPSAEKVLEIKELFRQAALDAYREEYKELSEVWKALETKAQGTITIGGIFIAAAFTFAKDLAATRLDYYGNLLLGASIFLLIPSVFFSILALKTREVSTPPAGETVEGLANDLLRVEDADLWDRKRRFINDQATLWKTTVTTTKAAIEDKERWLHLSQGFLMVAIVIAGALTIKLLKV